MDSELLKKILKFLLPLLLGSGVTFVVYDGFAVKCVPVIKESL